MNAPAAARLAVATTLTFAAAAAHAANAGFQSFFFDVCDSPSGALASRCAETPVSGGDLSGDSESSLNPSQNASHGQAPLGLAQLRSRQAAERAGEARDGDEARTSRGLAVQLDGQVGAFDRSEASQQGLERGLDGDAAGVQLGIDYRLSPRTVIGVFAGFESVDYDFDAEAPGVNFTPAAQAGDAESDNLYLTAFAAWDFGNGGYLDLAAGYERSDGTFRRNAVFQESTRAVAQTDVTTEGDADGDVAWASLSGGYDWLAGGWTFGPYAGVLLARAELDGYAESDLSGSGLAMAFGDTDRKSLLLHAGARASYAISTGFGVLVPQARAEYQRELEDDAQSFAARFLLDSAETVYAFSGEERDEDYATVALGISAILPNGWSPFLEFSLVAGNDELDRQRAVFGVRKEF